MNNLEKLAAAKEARHCNKSSTKEKDAKKNKGLWANIHAKRKRGEPPAKPGEKDYPDSKGWNKAVKSSHMNNLEKLASAKLLAKLGIGNRYTAVNPDKIRSIMQGRASSRAGKANKDLKRQAQDIAAAQLARKDLAQRQLANQFGRVQSLLRDPNSDLAKNYMGLDFQDILRYTTTGK